MITFPIEFAAAKYPGYYWNTLDKKLYSIKITGMLKPIAFRKASIWNEFRSGYQISVKGRKRYLDILYLESLVSTSYQIPIHP